MRIAISFLFLALVGVAFAEVSRNDEVRDLLLDLIDAAAAKRQVQVPYCGDALEHLIDMTCTFNNIREAGEGAFVDSRVAKRFFGNGKRNLHEECCVEMCHTEEILETC